jgi:hypothetical protein
VKEPRSDRAQTLLANGNLSGSQREEVLGRVLEGVQAAEGARRWSRVLTWAGASTALVAAAAILLWIRTNDEGLRAKGPARVAPIVRVDCEPGGLSACRLGGTLLFAVESAPPGARLAAYAEPPGGGERIWYFSGDDESPSVGDRTPDGILRRGIRVGPEHQPGAYRLTVFITPGPVPRATLVRMASDGRGALVQRQLSLTVFP